MVNSGTVKATTISAPNGGSLTVTGTTINAGTANITTNNSTTLKATNIVATDGGSLTITANGVNSGTASISTINSDTVKSNNVIAPDNGSLNVIANSVKTSSITAPTNGSLSITSNSLNTGTITTGTISAATVSANTLNGTTSTITGTLNPGKINFTASNAPDFSIGNTNGWIDINVPITTMGSGSNDPTITSIVGLTGMQVYTFPGSGGASMHQCWGIIHIPHDYAVGTGIYLHAHVLTDTAVISGSYKINFDYTYASSDGIFSAVQTVSVVDTFSAPLQHKITEIASPILTGNLEVDGVVMIRMWRDYADVQDTFTGDLHLMFIDAHCQVSKFSTKNRNKATGSFYV